LVLATATGWAGTVLGLSGAVLLLVRRLTDPDIRDFTPPAQIFDLAFFAAGFALFIAAGAFQDPALATVADHFAALMTVDPGRVPGGLMAAAILVASLLIAYVPFTYMLHFAAKYFFYHSIRWEDEEAHGNERLQKRILALLQLRLTWNAVHIRGDGRTWADVVGEKPRE